MNCECKNYEWLPRFYTAEHHPLCVQNPPPKTIEELTTRMESIFELGKEGNSAFAVTGEGFVKLCIGGPVEEGECFALEALYITAGLDFFYRHFLEFALKITSGAVSGYKLYWRMKPEIAEFELLNKTYFQCMGSDCGPEHTDFCKRFNTSTRFQIRTRLLISNKPEIKRPNSV